MTNFTHDNHLKYSIAEKIYGYRDSGIEKYSVTVGSIDKELYARSNYYSELKRTAELVYKDLGKDLVVFLSGGTDSEIVIRNFVDIGIKPRCAIVEFLNGYNAPDVAEAKEIAKELNVSLEVIPFDIKDFYNSGEATELSKEIQCTQITYLMVYYNILKLGFPAVMGGEVVLTRNISSKTSEWYYTFRENEDASAMRFSEKYKLPLVNEWFSYTPELLLYYLETPEIQQLITDKMNYKLTSVSSKNAILKRLCPDVRTKVKTHGFERLLGFNSEVFRALSSLHIKRLESSLDGIKMTDTIKMLRGIE